MAYSGVWPSNGGVIRCATLPARGVLSSEVLHQSLYELYRPSGGCRLRLVDVCLSQWLSMRWWQGRVTPLILREQLRQDSFTHLAKLILSWVLHGWGGLLLSIRAKALVTVSSALSGRGPFRGIVTRTLHLVVLRWLGYLLFEGAALHCMSKRPTSSTKAWLILNEEGACDGVPIIKLEEHLTLDVAREVDVHQGTRIGASLALVRDRVKVKGDPNMGDDSCNDVRGPISLGKPL